MYWCVYTHSYIGNLAPRFLWLKHPKLLNSILYKNLDLQHLTNSSSCWHLTVLKLWQIIYSVGQYYTCNNCNSLIRLNKKPSLSYINHNFCVSVTSLCLNGVPKHCEDAWDLKAIFIIGIANLFVSSKWCFVQNLFFCFYSTIK